MEQNKKELSTRDLVKMTHSDVKELREELLGNPVFKRKGIIERVIALERRRWRDIATSSSIGGLIGGAIVYIAQKLGIIQAIKLLASINL